MFTHIGKLISYLNPKAGAAFAAALILTACSGVQSTLVDRPSGPAYYFIIDDSTADRILRTAMAEEFPGQDLTALPGPNAGYEIVDDRVFEFVRVSAVRVPVSQPDASGTLGQGYAFETHYLGTLSYEGDMMAKRLFRRITVLAEDAELIRTPVSPRDSSRLSLFSLNREPLTEPSKSQKIDPVTGFVR